ncbi:MAG TPA: hypothetical protein VFA56_10760 [Gaiellaceae bacterium]|nr:hypothetical protein [Gaiellaceae bacterium]
MTTRLIPVLASVAVVVAGCASARATGSTGAAAVVPSSATAFVSGDTGGDWHGLETLLPAEWQGVRRIAGRVDVAVLHDKKTVAFVQPKDEGALADFVRKHRLVTRPIGAWTAVAHDGAALDEVEAAKTHLVDNERFREAMDALPGDARVRAYANGEEAGRLFAAIPGQLEARVVPPGAKFTLKPTTNGNRSVAIGVQQFPWLAASLSSNGDGVKLDVFAPRGELVASQPPRLVIKPTEPYQSALVDEIPAGALAVVDVQLPDGAFELLERLPKRLIDLLGGNDPASLPNELDAIMGGETALYVRPSVPMPEVTLVTQPSDTAAASKTLDSLLRDSPQLARTKLYRAVIGGQFVVSTTQAGIDAFRAGGAKLSSDPTFLEAKKKSGMPDRTTGFAYVNAKDALPLLALAGVKVPAGAAGVRTVAAYGFEDGGRSRLSAFLGVG